MVREAALSDLNSRKNQQQLESEKPSRSLKEKISVTAERLTLPSKAELKASVKKTITKARVANALYADTIKSIAFSETGAEAIANTFGLAGSFVGKLAVGGDVAEWAGDLVSAATARKVLKDLKTVDEAHRKLSRNRVFKDANRLKKTKMLATETLSIARSIEKQKEMQNDLIGDVAGWVIGNTAGAVGDTLPIVSNIPLHGGAVAMVAANPIAEAVIDIKDNGADPKETLGKAFTKIAAAPKEIVTKGLKRDRKVKEKYAKLKGKVLQQLAKQSAEITYKNVQKQRRDSKRFNQNREVYSFSY